MQSCSSKLAFSSSCCSMTLQRPFASVSATYTYLLFLSEMHSKAQLPPCTQNKRHAVHLAWRYHSARFEHVMFCSRHSLPCLSQHTCCSVTTLQNSHIWYFRVSIAFHHCYFLHGHPFLAVSCHVYFLPPHPPPPPPPHAILNPPVTQGLAGRCHRVLQLYTQDFYRDVVQPKLTPNGIFVTQSGPAGVLSSTEVFTAIHTTLRSVFPDVLPYAQHIPSYNDAWVSGSTTP